MKKVEAAIALLCLSTNALSHGIYSNLGDRDGHLCCGGQDCRPVEAVILPDGNYYLPASDEVIPADMASPSPDDRFHHCFYYPIAKVVDPWSGPEWESNRGSGHWPSGIMRKKSGGSVHPFSGPSLPSFSNASRRSQLTAFRSASSRISLRT